MTKVMNLSVNGIEMPCSVFGSGERTMVLLPGLSVKNVAESAGAVAVQYKLLTERYTVYIFDRRANIGEGYSLRDMAEDTAEVMHSLGLGNTYMFGASQGGMIAACIAADHPELVKKLLTASSAAEGNAFSDRVFTRWVELAEGRERTELVRDFLSSSFSPESLASFGDIYERLGRSFTDAELDHFVILAKALVGGSVAEELKGVRCPMLNVGAEGDRVFGTEGYEGIKRLTGCESYVYPGSFGHSVYDEAGDFVKRVYDFFER